MAHAVCLLLDQELLTLSRAVGALRRRNLAVASLALGPVQPAGAGGAAGAAGGGAPGLARLTVILDTDETTAEMTMRKLHKLSGVRAASRFAVDDGVTRELALVKVRVSHERYAELLAVCDTFKATLVDEAADQAVVQLAGTGSFVLAFLRALESFGILEMARTGAVALPWAPGVPGAAPAPPPPPPPLP